MGPSRAGVGWGAGASAHKAFSDPIRLLPEGEHVWRWITAPVALGQAPVPREREAAQTLLGPRANTFLGEKLARAAFQSKHTLALSLVSQQSFPFEKAAPRS